MYGIITDNNNGLRTLQDGHRVLHCVRSGYDLAWDKFENYDQGEESGTRITFTPKSDIYCVAFDAGCVGSMKKKGSIVEIDIYRHSGESKNIYVFEAYDGGNNVRDGDYGIEIFDSLGVRAYHSELLTASIIGYITKRSKVPVLLPGRSLEGRKIAFSQVGSDYSFDAIRDGYYYVETAYSTMIHNNAKNNITISEKNWTYYSEVGGNTTIDNSNTDILFFILDVTRIPIGI